MKRGKSFESGNKFGKGRPRGSRNKSSIFLQALEGPGVEIVNAVKRQALKGDPTAMRLCMERLLAPAKAPNARFHLGPLDTPKRVKAAISDLVQAVAAGDLSPQEGESVSKIIEVQCRALQMDAFDARLTSLEDESAKRSGHS